MRVFLFSFSILLLACSGDASRPKGVLSSEKMEAVLYDVIRADEIVDFLKLRDSTYQKFQKRTALYDTIFQLHNIQKEEFQKSLKFYQGRPDLLKEMLDHLQEKGTADTVKMERPSEAVDKRNRQ